ncbi:protein phosphatase 2C domain-containing protein [Azotobacter armeniacus]
MRLWKPAPACSIFSSQDAALAGSDPRPWLLLADGAGSSAVSELGARGVVSGLNCLLHTLDDPLDRQVATLLDAEQTPAPDEGRQLALLLVKHARGLLADLAAEHRRSLKDFRCTLLLAIPGQRHLLWLKIGDGALVIERTQAAAAPGREQPAGLETLGRAGKGEFANQTTFVDEQLQPDDVQSVLLSMEGIGGVALMSDGAADRLVSRDGGAARPVVPGAARGPPQAPQPDPALLRRGLHRQDRRRRLQHHPDGPPAPPLSRRRPPDNGFRAGSRPAARGLAPGRGFPTNFS